MFRANISEPGENVNTAVAKSFGLCRSVVLTDRLSVAMYMISGIPFSVTPMTHFSVSPASSFGAPYYISELDCFMRQKHKYYA